MTAFVRDGVERVVTAVSSFTILAPTATSTNTPCVDGRTSYQYDANGNLVREENCNQATLFEYDFENRLSKITHPDGRVETYLYDFSGHLVRKTVEGITTTSIYGRGVAPYSEKVEGSGTFTNFLLVNGKTYAKRNNGTLKFFHHDALGSVSAISDTSGTLTDTYEYDPFGRLLAHNGTEVNDRLFVGGFGVRDIGQGRSIMGVRLYDAELGRFLQEDPIGFAGGDLNLHRYVRNNPVRAIDPWGLEEQESNQESDEHNELVEIIGHELLIYLAEIFVRLFENPLAKDVSLKPNPYIILLGLTIHFGGPVEDLFFIPAGESLSQGPQPRKENTYSFTNSDGVTFNQKITYQYQSYEPEKVEFSSSSSGCFNQ